MKNVMMIEGQRAVIEYDPEIEMFRGEFTGLNGGADFYAKNITGLKQEGAASLKVFLKMCAEEGVSPYKKHSGKFVLRLDPGTHPPRHWRRIRATRRCARARAGRAANGAPAFAALLQRCGGWLGLSPCGPHAGR